jgi:hypothetical protein
LPKKFFDVHSKDCDQSFLDTVEWLECITEKDFQMAGDEPADMLDGFLEDIYDFFDKERVWIGG